MAGQLGTCQWLRERGCPMKGEDERGWPEDALAAAARGGHARVYEWLLATRFSGDVPNAVRAAARGGHVDLLERLLQRRGRARTPHRLPAYVLEAAAEGCDLPTLQRLCESQSAQDPVAGEPEDRQRPVWATQGVLAAAAASPTPDWAAKVEWLEAQGCRRTAHITREAASRPNAASRLAWLAQRGYSLSYAAFIIASKAGNATALQYLLSQSSLPRPDAAGAITAGRGHLSALQVLHAAGCAGDPHALIRAAALNGHLHVVRWLVEEVLRPGVQLEAKALTAAAGSGSVELMAWLRERGCPWEAATFTAAARSGCEAAVEWLMEHGCPLLDVNVAKRVAYRNGDAAMLWYLYRALPVDCSLESGMCPEKALAYLRAVVL